MFYSALIFKFSESMSLEKKVVFEQHVREAPLNYKGLH